MRSLTQISIILLAGTIGLSTNAFAHGTAAHAKKSVEPVEKEQTGWGIAGDAADAKRTVNVSMLDTMRFEPASVSVKKGETLRIVIQNNGKLMHEFVIGDQKSLEDHAALMVKFPKMEHEEPYMAHVAPGKKGEIVWKFNRGGDFHFACLIPGHYQAGMVGKLDVAGNSAHDHKKPMKHDHSKKK